ncbi:MAG TPA: response regulator [Syntrophorhabdaceae bacterium]
MPRRERPCVSPRLKEALTKGYHVTVMTDGITALRSFSHDPSRFDLVLTDRTMPGITGLELAGNALRSDRTCRIFFVRAIATPSRRTFPDQWVSWRF